MAEVSDKAAPVSRRTAWKILLTVAVLASAILGLVWASLGEGAEYYKHVDEARASQTRLAGKRLRLHGNVVPGTIVHQAGTLDYRFALESKAPRAHATMTVEFHGIAPDLFKEGAEVVAAGVLGSDGRLKSDRIETKCPSKYEAQRQE
ncbi:MAG: cytochrome c maturation protein CcmE [Deltaproteobacteria bacterium]|jgi:cytochrome c-type biogenesis protein CcmE|nr:cytochrome c maturation protein CcmE [Deltaproteobacteria bacterium]